MSARYAARTEVPIAKTRVEIEELVGRYGAAQYMSGYDATRAFIGFTMADRQVRFHLQLPDAAEKAFTTYRDGHGYERLRTADAAHKQWEQACRSRWRALLLVIKAKLEAVEVGISTFESEFLANIVMPDGQLVGELVRPRIAQAYETGDMPALLPPPAKEGGAS
ncbi:MULTISPECIES: hypothetical protein [Sphingobium]|uniref:hypothetical protein n=1 Tax=Sphingobium TaxID=165695 RepID=UPI0015EC4D31|nr:MULTISPECIES: hypothetical protein [Sphingobium]MCW2361650.1 hypothetical protein [Sphingobium sp. B10D3B]MCW2401671.1 hypothetical protein [Sphingobium sp. B10D7B]MCW2408651.1 hypothetical protein [Sphingobium xanthum]